MRLLGFLNVVGQPVLGVCTVKWWGYIFAFWRGDFIAAVEALITRTQLAGYGRAAAWGAVILAGWRRA